MINVQELLGEQASLLTHQCKTIPKGCLYQPGPDFIDCVFSESDRKPAVLRNLAYIFNTGRLAKTGYLSILPVDQGVEPSAAASFATNPAFFDPKNIVKLALEGGC